MKALSFLSQSLSKGTSLFLCVPYVSGSVLTHLNYNRLTIPILQIKLRAFNELIESHKGGKWQNWIQISSHKPDLCDSKAYAMPLPECQSTFRFSQPLTPQRASASPNSQANLCVPSEKNCWSSITCLNSQLAQLTQLTVTLTYE